MEGAIGGQNTNFFVHRQWEVLVRVMGVNENRKTFPETYSSFDPIHEIGRAWASKIKSAFGVLILEAIQGNIVWQMSQGMWLE